MGILAKVSDEGEFFDKRDVPALVQTIGNWNQFIAGLVGDIGDSGVQVADAPIRNFPDFEHLEAKGRDWLDQFLQQLNEKRKPEPAD